jgi:hypothetical protein|tara:strand:- start:1015 stop:1359 length:345 start_codon:yes stop_codon:yes gene_type:complete
MKTTYFNNNVKQAIKNIGLGVELSSFKIKDFNRFYQFSRFPFLGYAWPSTVSLHSTIDFSTSVFNWISSCKEDKTVRNLLVKYITTNGECLKSSLELLGRYRNYCKTNGIELYV